MEVLSHELTLTLNEIFKQLASGKVPRDDTLLEKVLSWLQKVLHDSASSEQFLLSTGFTDCLRGVCFQEEIDFRVWAFLLRLSGHIASQLQETRIAREFLGTVQTVFSKTIERGHLWTQASIRCAWLNGLEFWLWDHQFFNEVVVDLMLQSLEDSSWFVGKASASLISRILHNTVTSGEGCLPTILLKHVVSCLDLKDSSVALKRRRFTACMQILESVCSEVACYSRLCAIIPHDDLISKLCFVIESSADEQMNERCTAVLQVMSALWQLNMSRDKLYEKLSELSQRLLLSSHLSMAMETAAWILERYPHGAPPSSIMLENICLLPLWISVRSEVIENDLSLLSPCPVDNVCYKNISTINHSPARHLSLVKMSLTLIMQLKSHLVHQDLVFGLVKDVLEQTTNDCSKHQLLLQTNSRLKHQCLDVLLLTISTSLADLANVLPDVCPVIVNLLLQPDHDQVTVSKAFELLSELLKFFGVRTCPQLDVLLARLPTILQRTVNSLNWDIRDTAMNFIGKLMSLCTDSAVIATWVEQNDILQYISGGLKDSESYVCASALNALGIMCHSILFQSEKMKSEIQTHLWPEVIKLCQIDAETFSRRAAMELVVGVYASQVMPFKESTFENVMLLAVSDPDWDIKLKAVAFWDAYAKDLFISRSRSDGIVPNVSTDMSYLGKMLTESQCLKALITAAEDCDKSVQLVGLKALKNVKEQSANWLTLTSHGEKADHSTNIEQLSSNSFTEETASAGEPLKNLLNYLKIDKISGNDESDIIPNTISLLRCLASLDLDSLMISAETSTDGHDGRPDSLLNDLVMSLVTPVTYGSGFTSSEEEDDDEMAVDCY